VGRVSQCWSAERMSDGKIAETGALGPFCSLESHCRSPRSWSLPKERKGSIAVEARERLSSGPRTRFPLGWSEMTMQDVVV
jgi:hypothetical protein